MAPKKRTKGKKSRATRHQSKKQSVAHQQARTTHQTRSATAQPIPHQAPSSRTISPDPPVLYTPPPPLPRPQVTTGAPSPPSHLFRTIRLLSGCDFRATWLCLRRKVERTLDHGARNRSAGGGSVAEGLYRSLRSKKASVLQDRELQMLPQLFIVKTKKNPAALRHESEILDDLRHLNDGKSSEGLIESLILRAQFTREPDTSWLALQPIFSCTLQQFGMRCVDTSESVPSWFFWHIFLCLVDGLEFVHAKGITHGDISTANIMLNPYPPQSKHRFRDYPNVVLIDFEKANKWTEEGAAVDVWSMLLVVRQVARAWSDWGQVRQYVAAGTSNSDPVAVFEREVENLPYGSSIQDVKERWSKMAVVEREKGPPRVPASLVRKAHDDLAREEEIRGACKVVLNKFGSKLDGFRWLIGGKVELIRAEKEATMLAVDTATQLEGGTIVPMEEETAALVEETNALRVENYATPAGEYAAQARDDAKEAGNDMQVGQDDMQMEKEMGNQVDVN